MLRAEVQWLRAGPTLKMEGQLVGERAEQARRLVTPDVVPKGLIVDMNGVSCVDAAGEHLLTWLASLGAVFTASTICAIAICERLGLPTAQRRKAKRDESAGERSSVTHSMLDEAVHGHRTRRSDVVVSFEHSRCKCS